jgi:hypothetical protein
VLNMATCVGVVLLPSVQAIRAREPEGADASAAAPEPIHDHTATGSVSPPVAAED